MNGRYTNERNIQMVIALMKAHNIHKVVASPGTTNITFVASIQDHPFLKSILRLMNGQLRILRVVFPKKAVKRLL